MFTGAGIGDLGLRAAGIQFLAGCELESNRCALAQLNFPESEHFRGDIWELKDSIVDRVNTVRDGKDIFIVSCTAPCQGMSKNGQGTLRNNIRLGKRPPLDPRNRLTIPALDVITALHPKWVVFENVVEMRNTIIQDREGQVLTIPEVIERRLGPEYVGQPYTIEMADYGVPQRRQRLITVYTRDPVAVKRHNGGLPLVPQPTHSREGKGLPKWVSVEEALRGFPELDSRDAATAGSELPLHRVPVLDAKKYEWIRHTRPGKSAFDNQCINPDCLFQGNPTHAATVNDQGINRPNSTTPLYCLRCGCLLPRPYTDLADGTRRIMSGYTSAYKRMDPRLPAPTLTRNLSYPCSDQKLHPFQNRVLSLAEAIHLHTIDLYPYYWGPLPGTKTRTKIAPDGLIRLVIGESVPPFFFEQLGRHMMMLSDANASPEDLKRLQPSQPGLWQPV